MKNSSNIDLIDKYLKEKDGREKVSHYPTDAETCIRKLYYAWKGIPISNPITSASMYRMAWGDAIERKAIYLFKEAGGVVIFEQLPVIIVSSHLKYPIHGYVDAVTQKDGEILGWEIKSSYGYGIRTIVKNKYPKESDLSQVLIYTRAYPDYKKLENYKDGNKLIATIGALIDKPITKFELSYFARDDAYRTKFIIEHKPTGFEYVDNKQIKWEFKDIITKFKRIEKALETETVPDRPHNIVIVKGEYRDKIWQYEDKTRLTKPTQGGWKEIKSAWACNPLYCKWSNYCWGDELERYKNEIRVT